MYPNFLSHRQLQAALRTPEMGVSILCDQVVKPFSVRHAADDDLICQNA